MSPCRKVPDKSDLSRTGRSQCSRSERRERCRRRENGCTRESAARCGPQRRDSAVSNPGCGRRDHRGEIASAAPSGGLTNRDAARARDPWHPLYFFHGHRALALLQLRPLSFGPVPLQQSLSRSLSPQSLYRPRSRPGWLTDRSRNVGGRCLVRMAESRQKPSEMRPSGSFSPLEIRRMAHATQ